MRYLIVLLSLFLMIGLVVGQAVGQGTWYPEKIRTGRTVQTDAVGANLKGLISIQTIPAAESSDDDQLVNGASLNSTTALALDPSRSQFLAQPDVPRCLLVTPSDVVTTAIKFTGTDISGATITEWANFSASSTPVTTAKAFATVTMINATTSGTTRTVKIGTSDKLGLNTKLSTNTVIMVALDNVRETTAPTVTVSSTVLAQNTIDTSTAPGGKVTKVWFIV